MRSATALAGLAALALMATLPAACQKQGEREIEYEYVYKGAAEPVAVAAGTGNPLSLAVAPSVGPANAKVTIVESSDFQ